MYIFINSIGTTTKRSSIYNNLLKYIDPNRPEKYIFLVKLILSLHCIHLYAYAYLAVISNLEVCIGINCNHVLCHFFESGAIRVDCNFDDPIMELSGSRRSSCLLRWTSQQMGFEVYEIRVAWRRKILNLLIIVFRLLLCYSRSITTHGCT